MKTNALSLISIAALLLFTGCTSDETTDRITKPQNPDTDGLTAFVVEDNKPQTRTTGEYDGSGINFYWTADDHLWVNNGTLRKDVKNNIADLLVPNPNIPTGVKRAATAKFYFDGTYSANSYYVHYTGLLGTGDKVNFSAVQNQPIPNDASHLHASGDCGTGLAQRVEGRYHFTLNHKASYLTFIPYSTQESVREGVLTAIQITADQAIAGQFNFNDNGVVLSSRPVANSSTMSIYLKLNNFEIPTSPDPTKNASIIVLPPGNYSRIDVEYHIHSNATNMTGIIFKRYTGVNLAAGKNKKVSADLQVKNYGAYNTNTFREWSSPANGCPNVNECYWYFLQGYPTWDSKTLWEANGHLYTGGMWFLKRSQISGFNASHYGGVDRTALNNPQYEIAPYSTNGHPNLALTNRFFFMPALGYGYVGGGIGGSGRYWTSTNRGGNTAYVWAFSATSVGVGNNIYQMLMPWWTVQ